MTDYAAPLRDMRFVLTELLDFAALAALPGGEDLDADTALAVLEEAERLCRDELAPLNRNGDEQGCTLLDGAVRTPDGFRQAYARFVDGGWPGLACDPAWGGQGLPQTLNSMVEEMICAANLSFGMYPGLTHGAYTALRQFGDDGLKALYLPKLVSGQWSGTMCLTEPQCGTDLGLLRTKATPLADGAYAVTGTKIFISAGEHDLTENIIHLVLARLPDAPAGVAGVSLLLVPKFIPDAAGAPGRRNAVSCGGLEHKMGIKGSATCTMNFDGATGWLVGAPHKGLRAMFAMMNEARIAVGVQGLGLGAAAYQRAAAYARDRLQGRRLGGALHPEQPADPLLVHPDVRRMLLTQRALTEGGRALVGWVNWHADIAERHPDPEQRLAAADFVALMTPVVKAFLTDNGFEVANLGMQVWGGHGYIRDNGMEQYVRDARIAQIYEGANGIQALDLVGRKLPAHVGRYLRRFFHPLADYLATRRDDARLAEFIGPLGRIFARLQQATALTARRGMADPEEAAAAASDYLALFGHVAFAWLWTRMAEIALTRLAAGADGPDGAGDGDFYRAKLATARFYLQRLSPRAGAHAAALSAGGRSMADFPDAAF